MKYLSLMITLLIFLSTNSHAKVWEDSRKWDERDIIAFSQWVDTKVNREIFSSPNSPYYETMTDCADAIYALMAIYSYENDLYFQIRISEKKYIDNRVSFLDKYEGVQRVKEFVHYIGKMTGTFSLARYNSYPVKIKSLRPGDIYITSWKKEDKLNHHAYMIKAITETGYFRLYSSSTPVKVRVLNLRRGMPLHPFISSPWGFKRVAPYYLISKERRDYSLEQYQIRKDYPDTFFTEIRKILAVKNDGLSSYFEMSFSNLCEQFGQRIRTVQSALDYFGDNAQCANADEFYSYSTPSLDSSIGSSLYKVLTEWNRVPSSQRKKIDKGLRHTLDYISGRSSSYRAKKQSFKSCPLYVQGKKYYIRFFLEKLKRGLISSHPNDNIIARWGGSTQRTSCPVYKQDLTIF